MKKLFLYALLIWSTALFAAELPLGLKTTKLIDLSWSNPTTEYLQKNLERMEKEAPVDGLSIRVWGASRTINGKKFIPGRNAWSTVAWKYEDFKKPVSILKSLKFQKLIHNFIYMSAYPPDGDWLSEEGWKIIENNYRIAAKVARESGLKGFLWDIEEYAGHNVWHYEKMNIKLSYDEAWKLAFRRGQSWGKAVFSEFPDAVILMPFMLTLQSYGSCVPSLNVAFVNGIVDVMPLSGTLVEGCEGTSYRLKSHTMYYKMQQDFPTLGRELILRKNQEKFRKVSQLAPALYIDPLLKPETHKARYRKDDQQDWAELGKLNFFRRYLAAAMASSPEYVWLYSEKGAWWDRSHVPQAAVSWERQCPGITAVIESLRTPELMQIPASANLIANGSFKKPLKPGAVWQLEMDLKKPVPGLVQSFPNGVKFKNCTFACLKPDAKLPVQPGQVFYCRFTAEYGTPDYGIGNVSFTYFDKKEQILPGGSHSFALVPKIGKKVTVGRFLIVPEGAAFLRVMPGVMEQQGGGEIIFHELSLLPL